MRRNLEAFAVATPLLAALFAVEPALAQKPGGVLRVHALDSPPSMSMLEEVDANPARAAMGIFNNLVMFDQHAKQNSVQSIVPDLATGWSWSEDGTQLTFPLREGVKWHDGRPFTARDVKCRVIMSDDRVCMTLLWREQDSNHRSRVAVAVVPRLAMDIRPAGAATVRLIAL